MAKWEWFDFSYISSADRMDSRRAAFLLYDFINMFNIEDFKILSSFGEFQNQRIEIAYIKPSKYKDDEIEDLWYEHIKKFTEPTPQKGDVK